MRERYEIIFRCILSLFRRGHSFHTTSVWISLTGRYYVNILKIVETMTALRPIVFFQQDIEFCNTVFSNNHCYCLVTLVIQSDHRIDCGFYRLICDDVSCMFWKHLTCVFDLVTIRQRVLFRVLRLRHEDFVVRLARLN